ncbi:MAG: hypothetical protein Q9222_004482, partial [Ikaeria aurantiellina]
MTDYYDAWAPPNNGYVGHFPTRDENKHAERRRIVNNVYSMSSVLESENAIDQCTQLFCESMRDFAKRNMTVDLEEWTNMYAFDVLGELFYGKMFGFMHERKDVGSYMSAIDSLLPVFTIGGTLPSYLTQAYFISTALFSPTFRGALGTVKHIENASKMAVERRRQEISKTEDGKHDMLRKMLEINAERGEKINFTYDDICVESHSSLFAGADTTSIAVNSILYHLMRSPAAYEKLTLEVDDALANGHMSVPMAYSEATKLPYLRACINEGMRLHPSVGLTMPRLVPPGGATISGFHFPEGYRIGLNGAVVHRDKTVFGSDADSFNPDRWIEGDFARMEKAMIQFGAGSRTCIGKNISLSQIYKLIPQIMSSFRIRLANPNQDWETHNYWFNKQTNIKIIVEERSLDPKLFYDRVAVRPRAMPSAVSHSLAHSPRPPPHGASKFAAHRSKSTFQAPTTATTDDLLSAILHGKKKSRDTTNRNQSPMTNASHQSPPKQKPTPVAQQSQKSPHQSNQSNSMRGQKRKAQEPLQHPSPRRQRQRSSAIAASRSSELPLPTRDEHPQWPPQLFQQPKEHLRDALSGHFTLTHHITGPNRNIFHCRLTCIPLKGGDSTFTEGHSTKRKDAEKAAYLHLAVKLKDNNVLKEGLAFMQVDKLDQAVMNEEKDAKLDIYNYAARCDALPEINVRSLARPRRGKGRKLFEVTVKLSEQNIEVTGRGFQEHSAEIAAALRFKEAAEKYQAEHGDQSLVIKDSAALTTDNSSKFFEYYRIMHPGISIELTRPRQEGTSSWVQVSRGIHLAQLSVGGKLMGQPVSTSSKKKAENLAYLTAAIELKKQEPEIFPGFFRALATGNGEILKPVAPIDMSVDEDCQLVMRETLLSARKAGLPDKVEEIVSDEQQESTRSRAFRRRLSPQQLKERTEQLERGFNTYMSNPKLVVLRHKKDELPMNQYRKQVLDLISNNPYGIIVGATGSGKTTQVPQIILEDAITTGSAASCNVICTQPRRIAATSVARRVAEERAQQLQDTVGYQVRFDVKLPKHGGSVTYCTTGILLQQLQHQPDEVMDGVSHLVIDEVHERDILIDFLLIILKKAMADRMAKGQSTPKVVLMSATMDTELFASYFQSEVKGKGLVQCPSLSVPGRTFPVKEKHLEEISNDLQKAHSGKALSLLQGDPATKDFLRVENEFRKQNPIRQKEGTGDVSSPEDFAIDWKNERKISSTGETTTSTEKDDGIIPYGLVATTIAHISKTTDEGAILVFLPGLEEMTKVQDLLLSKPLDVDYNDTAKYKVYILHSSQAAAQREVFDEVPQGCRKIILSTNIAETSITIPDVQYVVDTGKLREKQYDQVRRITQLKCTWISKSNSKQRAGRAGRVQNGNYYALFSAERYNSFRAVGLPEMLRSDLQEICLDIKAQAFKYPIKRFLAEALEPPSPTNVDASIMNLQALDALTDEEQITPLGRLLASLPVHPSLGKMIVLGVIFRCLDPMLVLGAAAAERNIFVNPLEARQAALQAKLGFVQGSGSDHIALLNAVREMRKIRDSRSDYHMRQWAKENFIHVNSFKTIDSTARQIEEILVDAGLVPHTPEHMRHNGELGDPSLNENSSKVPLIKALAIAGFHPNLATSTGSITHRTPGEANTLIHPSSVNNTPLNKHKRKDDNDVLYARPAKTGTLYAYSTMARSNDGNTIYLRDTTECTPLMATLFGGKLALRSNNILEMDAWLPFYVTSNDRHSSYAKTAKTVLELRKALERLLSVAFMDLRGLKERKGEGRGAFLADEKVRSLFAEGVVEVLGRDPKTPGLLTPQDRFHSRRPSLYTFGDSKSYRTQLSTCAALAMKNFLASNPTHTFNSPLPQNRQRRFKQIELRIQLPPYPLKQQDTDDDVHEIALQADVVRPHHRQHFVQNVSDLDIPERESPRFHAEHQMLHLQRKDLGIQDSGRLATPRYHQLARSIAIELRNGAEEVEEV